MRAGRTGMGVAGYRRNPIMTNESDLEIPVRIFRRIGQMGAEKTAW